MIYSCLSQAWSGDHHVKQSVFRAVFLWMNFDSSEERFRGYWITNLRDFEYNRALFALVIYNDPCVFIETFFQSSKIRRLHGALLARHCHLGGLNWPDNLRKRCPNSTLLLVSHIRTSKIESSSRVMLPFVLDVFFCWGEEIKAFLQGQKW